MKGNRSDLEMPLNQKYDRLNHLPDIWTGKDVQLDSDETHRWNNLRYNIRIIIPVSGKRKCRGQGGRRPHNSEYLVIVRGDNFTNLNIYLAIKEGDDPTTLNTL